MPNYVYRENQVKKFWNEKILHKSDAELIMGRLEEVGNIVKNTSPETKSNKFIDLREYYNFRNGVLRFLRKTEREAKRLPKNEQSKILFECAKFKQNMDILMVNHADRKIIDLEAKILSVNGNPRMYYDKYNKNMTMEFAKAQSVLNHLLTEVPPISEDLQNRCEQMKKNLTALKLRAQIDDVMQDVEQSMKEVDEIATKAELNTMFEDLDRDMEETYSDSDDYHK